METAALHTAIVKALGDIEKAELMLYTYEKYDQDDLYIGISQNFIISSKNRIMDVISVLERENGGRN